MSPIYSMLRHSMVVLFLTVAPTITAQAQLIRINFQPADHAPPTRHGVATYLVDSGEVFGPKPGISEIYGFDEEKDTRVRGELLSYDCRLGTFTKLGNDQWDIVLTNGNYRINLVLGDGSYAPDKSIIVEGTTYPDPEGANPTVGSLHSILNELVVVNDGTLTLEGIGGDTPLCYIEITPDGVPFPPPATPTPVPPNSLAFPGAEGFGKYIPGGRGGDVYHVTNLKRNGPGSFQWAASSSYEGYPRTVVFDVSGHIGAELGEDAIRIRGDNITIAGQTSPGCGITVRDQGLKMGHSRNLIMRYFRVRLGDQNKEFGDAPDAIEGVDMDGIIMDHMSLSWSIDGMMDTRRSGEFTVQWCIFAEPLNESLHDKGAHGYLMSFRGLSGNLSTHHNIFSSGTTRHPTLGDKDPVLNLAYTGIGGPGVHPDYSGISDHRNNLLYNHKRGASKRYGGFWHNSINNTHKMGPNSKGDNQNIRPQHKKTRIFLSGNRFLDKGDGEGGAANTTRLDADNYKAVNYSSVSINEATLRSENGGNEFPTGPGPMGITTEFLPESFESADASYLSITTAGGAGASLWRDAVDTRQINNILNGTGDIIDSQYDVGGWDTSAPEESRSFGYDLDGDGMADAWELDQVPTLDPSDPYDGNDGSATLPGYSNLGAYLHFLAQGDTVPPPTGPPLWAAPLVAKQVGYAGICYIDMLHSSFGTVPYAPYLDGTDVDDPDQTRIAFSNLTFVSGPAPDWLSLAGDDNEVLDGTPPMNGLGVYVWNVDATSGGETVTGQISIKVIAAPPAAAIEPIHINFQPAASTVPEGYLVDAGYAYGDRGNGYSYGWSSDVAEDSRDRGDHENQLYDTLLHFQKSVDVEWEIEIPNGLYSIDVVFGDAGYDDSLNHISVEDTVVLDPDGEDTFDKHFGIIATVADGRLTLSPLPAASKPKVCFIDISAITRTYDDWRAAPGTFTNPAGPNVARGNDFDEDGYLNEYEYYFNLDPEDPSNSSVTQQNPFASIVTIGPDYPAITYSYRIDAPNIRYQIMTSTDLETWIDETCAFVDVVGPTSNGNGTLTVTKRYDQNLDAVPLLFIRVVATEL